MAARCRRLRWTTDQCRRAGRAICAPALGDMVRWEDQLAPDLLRAAPEIFRSCRFSGPANIRDWLHRHYAGAKDENNPKWTDLWNAATEIDFAVARCSSAAELNQLLVSNDGIEIKLRRMAAEEYRARTGDLVGANQMLAVKAPGVGVDLAPGWLVSEVTQYSKVEHQRQERVKASGRGGRGAGQANQQQVPQGEQAGGAGERGRGGRGGRGGRK